MVNIDKKGGKKALGRIVGVTNLRNEENYRTFGRSSQALPDFWGASPAMVDGVISCVGKPRQIRKEQVGKAHRLIDKNRRPSHPAPGSGLSNVEPYVYWLILKIQSIALENRRSL